MVVSIDQGHVIAAESEVQFSTIEQIAPAPSKLDGVTYDQVQPVESMSNQDGAGAIHADELPLVHTSTSHNGDTNDPNPRPKSPRGADETPATDLSRVPEPYTPPGE